MYIVINIGKEQVVLTEENTRAYKFRNTREVDHVYYETTTKCFYIFDCEKLIFALENGGVTTILADNPTQDDLDAYVNFRTVDLEAEIETLK